MATTSTYTLVAEDIPVLVALLQVENSMMQLQGSPTNTDFNNLMTAADTLCRSGYPSSTGTPEVQTWVDGFFTTLATAQTTSVTTAGNSVSLVYAAWAFTQYYNAWAQINNPPGPMDSWLWCAFVKGPITFVKGPVTSSSMVFPGPWTLPTQPAAWATSVSASVKGVVYSASLDNFSSPETRTLNSFPGFWKDYINVPTAFTIWSLQSADLSGLLGLSSLADSQALFMLYVMVALTTSSASDQALVNNIANTPVSSAELPNSNFAQHLAYFVALYLNDPTGWDWPPEQISTLINSLAGAIPEGSAAATLLAAFTSQQQLFTADPAYPSDDPNNPGIAFQQRYSDVLGAINGAWPPASSS